MAAVKYDLTGERALESGATWNLPVRYVGPPDPVTGDRASALPTGWTVKAQWRKHPNDVGVLVELNPDVDHATGGFELVLTGEQVASLPGLCFWGVKAFAPGGEPSIPLIEGKVDVELAIVR